MAVDHVKSSYITNLDATPSVANTAGEGGPARLQHIEGSAVAVASGSIDSTYQMVRVPSNCKIKSMIFESAVQAGGGRIDIGAYYATDGEGGKPAILLAANAINQAYFLNNLNLASAATVRTDVLNSAGNYTIDKRTQPLWQALGLASDPGGFIDIVVTVMTTAFVTGTGRMGLSVSYTD